MKTALMLCWFAAVKACFNCFPVSTRLSTRDSHRAETIIDSISPALGEVAQAFGLAPLAISVIVDSEYLLKIKVESEDQRTLFTIDVSRTSAVHRRRVNRSAVTL